MRPVQLMIIGAQKAGTTSLLQYLAQHPYVCTHGQSEMAYFMIDSEYDMGYDRAFQRFFGNCQAEYTVLMAKHAMLMYSLKAVKRLYSHNPPMRLVVLLRDPIERAYSAYWYARRMGWENIETFREAIEAEPARLRREGWLKWRNCAYLYNSTYIKHMVTLFENFEKEQVHVYLTEELRRDPAGICRSILTSFRLDSTVDLDLGHRHNTAKKARSEIVARFLAKLLTPQNPIKQFARSFVSDERAYQLREKLLRLNETEFTPPPINPSTRAHLEEYFEPHNAELVKLLELDLSHWNHSTS